MLIWLWWSLFFLLSEVGIVSFLNYTDAPLAVLPAYWCQTCHRTIRPSVSSSSISLSSSFILFCFLNRVSFHLEHLLNWNKSDADILCRGFWLLMQSPFKQMIIVHHCWSVLLHCEFLSDIQSVKYDDCGVSYRCVFFHVLNHNIVFF